MALVQRTYLKVRSFVTRLSVCCYSKSVQEKDIKKSVYISQSKDIYANLALEDWIYRNVNFKNHHILMLWQSDPCVVIGRHQNPWLEANVPELSHITDQGVKLARRNSGGGTVYHDNGNLNLTFFTPREHYSRKYNLEIITRSLFREFGLKADISAREDLMIRNYKVSGTASKLGRPSAYHHCTLLVNANKLDLSLALQKQNVDIKTNATKSIKSKIMNLCEEHPDISITKLIKAIGWEFMRTPALSLIDGGIALANKQKGFQLVNPTNLWFPGLDEIRDQFVGWEWCYGKTPKFNISKSFTVPDSLVHSYGATGDVKVTMTVEQGRISDVTLLVPPALSPESITGEVNVVTSLIGQKFSEEALNCLEGLLSGLVKDKDKFVTECLRQVMSSV